MKKRTLFFLVILIITLALSLNVLANQKATGEARLQDQDASAQKGQTDQKAQTQTESILKFIKIFDIDKAWVKFSKLIGYKNDNFFDTSSKKWISLSQTNTNNNKYNEQLKKQDSKKPSTTDPKKDSKEPTQPNNQDPRVPSILPDSCFPVKSTSFSGRISRNFGDERVGGTRCHVGVDIYTQAPGEVVAIEDGKVIKIKKGFTTCSEVEKNWGLQNENLESGSVARIMVYNSNLDRTINYGEVDDNKITVNEGDTISKGQKIGVASYCAMLHLETYKGRVENSIQWYPPAGTSTTGNNKCQTDLLIFANKDPSIQNPTSLVNSLQDKFCDIQTTQDSTQTIPSDLSSKGFENDASSSTKTNWNNAARNLVGRTFMGKLSSNGINDNHNREDQGRDNIIFVPNSLNTANPVEIIYYQHGNYGFSGSSGNNHGGDMAHRIAPQLNDMVNQGRNFIFVFPEMPWSLGIGTYLSTDRTTGRVDKGFRNDIWLSSSDSNLIQFDRDVLGILKQNNINLNQITRTFIGHSMGGKALANIANSGAMSQLKPQRITFSDSDYGSYTKIVYDNYAKNNNPELNLLVIHPTRSDAQAPTTNTIQFMKTITSNFNQNEKTSIGNIHYVPLQTSHDSVALQSLKWQSGSNQLSSTGSQSISNSGTCTYKDEENTITTTFDKLSGEQTSNGCTLCREDKVTINSHGQTFKVCKKYETQIKNALNSISNDFPINSITGFREGRTLSSGTKFGRHAYGSAIDINRNLNGLYNNCRNWDSNNCQLSHGGQNNPTRDNNKPGTLFSDSSSVTQFNSINWKWGGDWTTSQKDFMHFSDNGR